LTFLAAALLPVSMRWSGMTRWNWPFSRSSSDDTASLWRSSDFGVITTNGLRQWRNIWRRSMWNICAGVVGTHTCMLSSAHNCR